MGLLGLKFLGGSAPAARTDGVVSRCGQDRLTPPGGRPRLRTL